MKRNYYCYQIEINKDNIKKTWDILTKVIGKQNNKLSFPRSFKIEQKIVSDKDQIAESFNTYFSAIGRKTGASVKMTNKHFTHYLGPPNVNSMFIDPVLETDVLDIVNKLKPKTSHGHDEIPTKIVKETIDCIIQPLTHIVNASLQSAIFPDQLKIAKVVPIYKSSDQDNITNYRPVSLLPAFSKVFEKVMYKKIAAFFNSQNLFYEHQYGFRTKHSTIHPIIHLLNECAESMNCSPQKSTLAILCDLSKAFDVINHEILIGKKTRFLWHSWPSQGLDCKLFIK